MSARASIIKILVWEGGRLILLKLLKGGKSQAAPNLFCSHPITSDIVVVVPPSSWSS